MTEKIDSLEATVVQQRKEYAELKAMVIDLQLRSPGKAMMASVK